MATKSAAKRKNAKTKTAKTAKTKIAKTAKTAKTKKVNKKILKELISKGKKQGSLTYEEINKVFSEEMLSPNQFDETLIMFDDL
ncbi:MAG: RNA polymerase sigma factor region1.1 domain-containing protein, partial [Deltaproteobacteria bacterium]|nr:RNA polymerase sigma factor region1.1 domain-containing protein [Deltaproteobacteria bacterium]